MAPNALPLPDDRPPAPVEPSSPAMVLELRLRTLGGAALAKLAAAVGGAALDTLAEERAAAVLAAAALAASVEKAAEDLAPVEAVAGYCVLLVPLLRQRLVLATALVAEVSAIAKA